MATTPVDQNAYNALVKIFQTFDLGSLAPDILKLVQQGITDAPTVELMLQDTQAWKQRFAGNEIRRKNGLNVLDPATYLDLENQYNALLKQFGIPKGQYGRSDFAEWMGNGVSPAEIQDRLQMASAAVYNADDSFKNALNQLGIDQGHQISYFLDPEKSDPFLQRQFHAAQIGGAALRHNLGMDNAMAQQLASLGITSDQANAGYAQIAQELPKMNKLAQLSGQTVSQNDFERQLFMGDQTQTQRFLGYQLAEQARFGGSGGAGTSLYHPDYALSESLQGAY